MPKGYFTAAAVVLAERTPAMAEIQQALQRFPLQCVQRAPNPGWMGAAEQLMIALGQEPRGRIIVVSSQESAGSSRGVCAWPMPDRREPMTRADSSVRSGSMR